MSTMRQRMLDGKLYRADDEELEAALGRAQELLDQFNGAAPGDERRRSRIMHALVGEVEKGVVIRPPFRCDYGSNIRLGAGTFINYDAVILDAAPVVLGVACQLGPRVQLLTSTHPIDPRARRAGWETADGIALGDNVWLGGGAIVCPGVVIGPDTVVGAGAVVTRDLPAGVVAVGNPARILRAITARDRVEIPVV